MPPKRALAKRPAVEERTPSPECAPTREYGRCGLCDATGRGRDFGANDVFVCRECAEDIADWVDDLANELD